MIKHILTFIAVVFLSCAPGPRSSAMKKNNNDCRSWDHVVRVTQTYLPGMNVIYNERLKTNPTLKGRLVVVFYVQASGLITQPPVIESSSLGDTVFEKQCVEYLRTWNYGHCGSRKKTMQIIYPFDFNTGTKSSSGDKKL